MPRPDIDLSFARYVAARKGEVAARTREGAAYAYAGDIKVRAALDRVRPVTLAVEATIRLWQSVEKSRMLGTAVKVTRVGPSGSAQDDQAQTIPHAAQQCLESKNLLGIMEELGQAVHGWCGTGSSRRSSSALSWDSSSIPS